jgi:signal transduction histidine kinase
MKFLPKTLVMRTTLVLLAGLFVSNLVGLLIYTGERSLALKTVVGEDTAKRIAAVTRTIDGLAAPGRDDVACTQSGTGFAVMLTSEPLIGISDYSGPARRVFSVLNDLLDQPGADRLRLASVRINEDSAILETFQDTLTGCTDSMAQMRGMQNMAGMHVTTGMMRIMQGWNNTGLLEVSYRLGDGNWVNFLTTPPQASQLWNRRFLLAFVVMAVIVTALSVWAVRRSTAPLDLFAQASERLGRDMNAPDMAEDGPREVSRAAQAFNDMQRRLRRLISDRTQMLAAVSHDLRTPVTRLRLRAEFIEDDEQREKMLNDLAQMEAMIAATLSFARLDSSDEARKTLDLAGLVQSVCDDASELGQQVTYQGPGRVSFCGRPLALRRVFDNLVDNAVKYGARAEVALVAESQSITITIRDNGPGIPPSEIDQVFKPFHRVESSRNRETGGVGLGLAVVRSIIRGHGGEVTLNNQENGGLCATVTLPLPRKNDGQDI